MPSSAVNESGNKPRATLMGLPLDVRSKVWGYTGLLQHRLLSFSDHYIGRSVGLLRVNRELHDEGVSILYGPNSFVVDPQSGRCMRVLRGLSSSAWRALRQVYVILYLDRKDFWVSPWGACLCRMLYGSHGGCKEAGTGLETPLRVDAKWLAPMSRSCQQKILEEVHVFYLKSCRLAAQHLPEGCVNLTIFVGSGLINAGARLVDFAKLQDMLHDTCRLPKLRSLKLDLGQRGCRGRSGLNSSVRFHHELARTFTGICTRLVRPQAKVASFRFDLLPPELQTTVVETALEPAVRPGILHNLVELGNAWEVFSRELGQSCCGKCSDEEHSGVCYCPRLAREQPTMSSSCSCTHDALMVKGLLGASREVRTMAERKLFRKGRFSIDGSLKTIQRYVDYAHIRSHISMLRHLDFQICAWSCVFDLNDLRTLLRTTSNVSNSSALHLQVSLAGVELNAHRGPIESWNTAEHEVVTSAISTWHELSRFASLTCVGADPYDSWVISRWAAGKRKDFEIEDSHAFEGGLPKSGPERRMPSEVRDAVIRSDHKLWVESMRTFVEVEEDLWGKRAPCFR